MNNNHVDKKQPLPGKEENMSPPPQYNNQDHVGSNKLQDKVAIITGGDSGIGRAIAIAYVKEGAKVVISYLDEDEDALKTGNIIKDLGGECVLVEGDLTIKANREKLVNTALEKFGGIDILVNHAGKQYLTEVLDNITEDSILDVFNLNVFAVFHLTKLVLPHLKPGSAIINTTSIVAYKGNPDLADYAATRGAIATFTRTLATGLASKGIRVNAVAPGPVWTPLIVGSFTEEKMEKFGEDTLLGRPGQPYELAPAYVFLASNIDSSYITGQTIHVNGGTIVNI